MKALLIEFDPYSGKRAGGISPKDGALRCHGWQNLEYNPALEIRLIGDQRDLSQYEGIPGVTILNTDEEIEKAIDDYMPVKYSIGNELFFKMEFEEKKLKISDFIDEKGAILFDKLKKSGMKTIIERRPPKLKEVTSKRCGEE